MPGLAATRAPRLAAVVAQPRRRRYRLTVTIIDWSGIDVPEALRRLSAGQHAMKPLDEAFELSADQPCVPAPRRAHLEPRHAASAPGATGIACGERPTLSGV